MNPNLQDLQDRLASSFLRLKRAANSAASAKKAHDLVKGGEGSKLLKALAQEGWGAPYYASEGRDLRVSELEALFDLSSCPPLAERRAILIRLGLKEGLVPASEGAELDHARFRMEDDLRDQTCALSVQAPGPHSPLLRGGDSLRVADWGVLPDGAVWEFAPGRVGGSGTLRFWLTGIHVPAEIKVVKDPAALEALLGVAQTGRSLKGVLEFAARTGLKAQSKLGLPTMTEAVKAVKGATDLAVAGPARDFALRAFTEAGVVGLETPVSRRHLRSDLDAYGFRLSMADGSPLVTVFWNRVFGPGGLTVLEHPATSARDWADLARLAGSKIPSRQVLIAQGEVDALLARKP